MIQKSAQKSAMAMCDSGELTGVSVVWTRCIS